MWGDCVFWFSVIALDYRVAMSRNERMNLLADHIRALIKECEWPYTGFGDYTFQFTFQDHKLTLIESKMGKTRIKP